MKICSVQLCNKIHDAKGLCAKHYQRMRASGSAKRNKNSHCGNWIDVFGKNKGVFSENGCMEWVGTLNHLGYGVASHKGKRKAATQIIL